MKTYTFNKKSAYTSYNKLSASEVEAIERSNYSEYPNAIILNNRRLSLDELFERYHWSDRVSRAGYVEIEPGCFVRFKILSYSPDYFRPNGNGECLSQLKIRTNLQIKFQF